MKDLIAVPFAELMGKTLVEIECSVGDEQAKFITKDGEKYHLTYYADCCANCTIEDVCGDVRDLLNEPILLAEEVTSNENPEGVEPEYQDSFTWTFYKLATNKGFCTIRWYGKSNGYYSETATFEKVLTPTKGN